MILKMFALMDSKVGEFMQPWFSQHTGQATRAVADLVNDGGESMISRHAEDFALFELGQFDTTTGQFELHPPQSLGGAIQWRKAP